MQLALAQLSSTPDRAHNLDKVLRAMETAHERGAEAVVFPEVVLDPFFPQFSGSDAEVLAAARALAEPIPGPTTERIAEQARKLGLVTVFNLYEVDGEHYYDSSPVFDADGSLLGVTRMQHICYFEGFYEKDYYDPADTAPAVYQTRAGRIGVAICYDRHYPEYLRALALAGADLVVIPQAGALGEWPEGLFEAEVRTGAFQHGYFMALCNRVGAEETLTFGGGSFAVDPDGRVLATATEQADQVLVVELDLDACNASCGRRLFLPDRRPELYPSWLGGQESKS